MNQLREWLILKVTAIMQALAKSKEPDPEVEVEKTADPLCPMCGMEWDAGEIFCYNCGYEYKDEEYPLNPPPERIGSLTDPDKVVDETVASGLRDSLDAVAKEKGLDIAIFIVPGELAKCLEPKKFGQEYLDGLGFALYNTWRMGKDTDLKGMLVMIDPRSEDRAMVLGHNGPHVLGSTFREWYAGMSAGQGLSGEVEYLIGKIKEI